MTSSELSEARRDLLEKLLRGDAAPAVLRQAVDHSAVVPPETRVQVIAVQPNGSQPPLFYLHVHWIGGAFYSFRLAQELGPDQPIYVINTYRFDDLPVPPTIEEMATACIEGIRAARPNGPYRLAGFCGGGLIAYEVAQQLTAQGSEVDNLILIDPNAGPIRSIRLTGRTIRSLGNLFHRTPEEQVNWFLRIRYLWRIARRAHDENSAHVDHLLQEWRAAHVTTGRLLPDAVALRQDWMNLFIWAVSAYVPRRYDGKMTYLFAEENPDVRRVWWGKSEENELAHIQVFAGNHESCRDQHLPQMVAAIRNSLG